MHAGTKGSAQSLYRSTFPSDPLLESYLRADGLISDEEATAGMVERTVAALAEVDRSAGSAATDANGFSERLGRELDAGRVVLSPAILANAGRDPPRPLADCAAPQINLHADLDTVRAVVDRYHQAGMGTGFNLDDLDDPIAMVQYLNYVAAVGAASDKELRNVGNIALLSLTHPEAEDFVTSKVGAAAEGEVWKFDIGLRVTDADMHAALRRPGRERALLRTAAEAAHDCAEPLIVFTDRLNDSNPVPHVGRYVATPPCAAVGLLPAESCVFGHVNLAKFHRQAARTVPVDLTGLADVVYTLVRALDDAVEVGLAAQPTMASRDVTGAVRKIGVGVCGLAELLVAADVPYESLQAHVIAQETIAYINYVSKLASVELAVRRGPCRAVGRGQSRYSDPGFLRRFASVDVRSVTPGDWAALADRIAESGLLRNAVTTAISPAPHALAMFGATSGIDPVAPDGHLSMAAAVQACVDEAVSTTVHLPAGTRPDDVYETYVAAWELRCKTVAVTVDDD